jgi:hypothetical protein
MKLLSRFVLCLSASLVLMGGLCGLAQCCGLDLGLDQFAELARAQELQEVLVRRNQQLCARSTAKQHVTDEVLGRRLTLLEGAAAFRRIDESTTDADSAPHEWDDLSDEGVCRNLLNWVKCQTIDEGRGEDRLRELEAEYAEHFHHAPDLDN